MSDEGDGDAAAQVRDHSPPAAAATSSPEALAERAFAEAALRRWALTHAGLSEENVAAAGQSESLAEGLVLLGLVDMEELAGVLDPEVTLECEGCRATVRVGEGLAQLAAEAACPRCGGALTSESTTKTRAGPRRVGGYEVKRPIGHGGMAAVFEAVGPDGRVVALKVLRDLGGDDAARARFSRERRLWQRLDHPNVVRVEGGGIDEVTRSPFLALELVRGGDLMRLVDERPDTCLDVDEACYVLARSARGLRYIHEQGIIHRDIKPSNLLLTPAGQVKIADFGLASGSDVSQRLTAKGQVVGTPQYVPPEVLKLSEWSAASDAYSLASCAFRLITGAPAFNGNTVAEVLEAHLLVVPPTLLSVRPTVPPEVSDVVARMLAKDPAARPSLDEAIDVFERFQASEEAVAARWGKELAAELREELPDPREEQTIRKGQLFQSYRLEEELGRGGMGIVYRAFHLTLKKQAAIKVLLSGALASEADRRRFLREAEAAGALQHPAIVPVLDAGEHEGTYFLAMDFVEGVPLSKYYAQHPDLPALLRLFARVCDGVHHAHSRGIIHRDLKPENVLVDRAGEPRILDFGVAKRVDRAADEAAAALTTEGDIIGTLRYMPPEQAAGRAHQIDVRSDVYALGSVLYELVTGGLTPFRGGVHELLQQILFEEPKAPSTVVPARALPWELDAICLKAIEKDRDQRYQSALELRRDVERFLQGLPITARQATSWYRLRKWVVRNRRAVIAWSGVGLLAATLGGAFVAERVGRERERCATVVAAAREGWTQFARGEFDRAAVSFRAGGSAARADDRLPLPDDVVSLLPPHVLSALADDERRRPRVTHDRLLAWSAMAQELIRSQQAAEHVAAARAALAAGDLEAARTAALAARLLMPQDPAVKVLATAVADGYLAVARGRLETFARRDAAATEEREADVDAAAQAVAHAQGLTPEHADALEVLLATRNAGATLASEREHRAAFEQARARVARAAELEREADAATDPKVVEKRLQDARVALMSAHERWPALESARDGLTRVALRLGALALAAEKFDVAETELSAAGVFELRRAEVEAFEASLRAQDRRARAFAALRAAAEAAYARGELDAARAHYELALEQRDDPEARRRRDLCAALLDAAGGREAGDLLRERDALRRAQQLDEDGARFAADLARLDARLHADALAVADRAYRDAQARGAGWQDVVAAYERALRFAPDGPEALRGRADALAERDRPADMVLVSVPARLVARGAGAARIGPGDVVRFYVDREEVSTAAYARFVAAGGYERRELWTDAGWAVARSTARPWPGGRPPAGTGTMPVTHVTAHEAAAYARAQGRRLPTEREWVLAACFDLPSAREQRYPWGDASPATVELRAFRRVGAVGSNRADTSPWGALDMAFNVAEWTASEGGGFAVRGLCASFFPHDLAAGPLEWRRTPAPELRHAEVGFRCVAEVAPTPPLDTTEGPR